jgi:hypothetical protein
MHNDTLAAAKIFANLALEHGDIKEVNQYGDLIEHLSDLIEDAEADREEGE